MGNVGGCSFWCEDWREDWCEDWCESDLVGESELREDVDGVELPLERPQQPRQIVLVHHRQRATVEEGARVAWSPIHALRLAHRGLDGRVGTGA